MGRFLSRFYLALVGTFLAYLTLMAFPGLYGALFASSTM